jgi:hypothetical protein
VNPDKLREGVQAIALALSGGGGAMLLLPRRSRRRSGGSARRLSVVDFTTIT